MLGKLKLQICWPGCVLILEDMHTCAAAACIDINCIVWLLDTEGKKQWKWCVVYYPDVWRQSGSEDLVRSDDVWCLVCICLSMKRPS